MQQTDDELGVALDDLPNFRPQTEQFEDNYQYVQDDVEYAMPDTVKNFIKFFYDKVRARSIFEIQDVYETTWHKLTERFYKNDPWPSAQAIESLCDGDEVFLMLYNELYYRHIYAKLKPTLDDRVQSFENYCQLFELVLNRDIILEERLTLPSSWLCDMVDEFIYQFQAFAHYRTKLKGKDEDEISMLKDCEQGGTWDCAAVFKYLHSLVKESNIVAYLNEEEERLGSLQSVELDLFKLLGYFSVIGLLRMHCLTADFRRALKQLDTINIARRGLLKGGMPCHITTYYYMGFAYMMHRRYVDAIKALSNILLYINRTKQYHTRSSSYDVIIKKNEQMFALLALLVSLCPYRLEENLQTLLREKYAEKVSRMQRGDRATFEELFSFACPKFVDPSPPNYDALENLNQAATKHQCTMFMKQVMQSVSHPTIRSFLKLYTTIPTNKLGAFLGWTEDEFIKNVCSLKHKSHELVWNGGSATSGIYASSSDVEFYIDDDMVHINDPKVVRHFDEFFIKHINKFDEIVRDLNESREIGN